MKTISTQAQAKTASKGRYRVAAAGVANLYFKKTVDTVGVGSFVYRYWRKGRKRYMGLGALATTSLSAACEHAKELAAERIRGGDPIENRRAAKALAAPRRRGVTFAAAAQAYLKAHAPSWKNPRSGAIWFNPIARYAFPVIGKLGVDDIVPEHVAAVVRAAVEAGHAKTGLQIRARIEAVLDSCIAKGERDAARGNPADGGLIAAIIPTKVKKGERRHFRRIPLDGAPAAFRKLWAAAEAKSSVRLDAWLFMVLTAARPGEALHCDWTEIDPVKRLWRIPAPRMKGAHEHIVPLSEAALEVLERRRVDGDKGPVFPGRNGMPLAHSGFARAPGEIGVDAGAPHSWRSVFRDWAGDVGRIDRDLAESALAHSLGKTEAAYRRGSAIEARRPVMALYSDWLSGADATVVAFPVRA